MKFKRFFSGILLMIGVLVGVLLPTHFSVAQNNWLAEFNLLLKLTPFTFEMPDQSLYLYAVTEPNNYTIYFNGNGNTAGNMDSMPMVFDKAKNLNPNRFEREGHVFIGWSTGAVGNVVYQDEESVKNLTSINTGEVTLYAQRVVSVPYTVVYYQETLTGDEYEEIGTVVMNGIEGTPVPSPINYTGFTLRTGEQLIITPGLEVAYYYDRNSYILTIKDRKNTLTGWMKYGANIPLPENLTWTGNTFLGWANLPSDGKMPANDLEIISTWSYGVHTITFDTDGGTEIPPITGNYLDPITPPANPKKDGYEFVSWSPELPERMLYDDITVTAIWKKVERSSGSKWSGGGGRGGGKSNTPTTPSTSDSDGGGQHGSSEGNPVTGDILPNLNVETLTAYWWAYKNGIIVETWTKADPDGYVPRGDMAAMIVRFTEYVLKREIPQDIPSKCSWGDAETEWKSKEIKEYARKACALGIMGIRMENFNPNKLIDRAEFGTILSRLLWGDRYDEADVAGTDFYYLRHLEALNNIGVIKQIENPKGRLELRKWSWLMFMRVRF